MNQTPEIENFGNIIESYLKEKRQGKLISYKSKYLTKPGDNYGSIILAVTVNIQTLKGNIEELEMVAKLPPSVQELWEIFQPERTFVTETKCYIILAPALKELQKEVGIKKDEIIDIFPECYGARFNLNGKDENVDKNAVLILENLITCGYKVGDRFKGFDYDHTLVILRNLAYFHALPIALRKLKPEMFEKQIKPFVKKFDISANVKPQLQKELEDTHMKALKKSNVSEEDLNKIMKLFQIADKLQKDTTDLADGPYVTIVHSDFWVNNMMILYGASGKPDKVKIVDLQIAQYENLINDVIFFLLTSVDSKVLKDNFQKFLHYYYNQFVACQAKIGCDTSEYLFESFMNEFNRLASLQVPHIIMMLRVLFLKRDAIADFHEMDTKTFTNDDQFGEEYYEKLSNVVNFLKKFNLLEIPLN